MGYNIGEVLLLFVFDLVVSLQVGCKDTVRVAMQLGCKPFHVSLYPRMMGMDTSVLFL